MDIGRCLKWVMDHWGCYRPKGCYQPLGVYRPKGCYRSFLDRFPALDRDVIGSKPSLGGMYKNDDICQEIVI